MQSPILANDKDVLLGTMEVAVDEWLTKSSFLSSYVFYEGVVASEDNAKRFDIDESEITQSLHGDYNKLGSYFLYSCTIDKVSSEHLVFVNGTYVVGNNIELGYIPEFYQENIIKSATGIPKVLRIFEKDSESQKIPYPTTLSAPGMTPLVFASGPSAPNFFNYCKDLSKIAPNAVTAAIPLNNNKVKITFKGRDPASGIEVSEYAIFSTSSPYPVPEESVVTTTYPNGDVVTRKSIASEFVDTGDGIIVPRKIMMYEGPLTSIYGEELAGKWYVRKWISNDLGNVKPTMEHFLFPLNPDTRYIGLKHELELKLYETKPKLFDISKITLRDLEYSSYKVDMPQKEEGIDSVNQK